MIIPCIDLMDGKVVQLRQGREESSKGNRLMKHSPCSPDSREIQVIDLDAAMGRGSNLPIVEHLASRASLRVGGGIRTVELAQDIVKHGAAHVIVGTAAFSKTGPNYDFLEQLAAHLGPERIMLALDSKEGKIVVKGWQESTTLAAVDLIADLAPYCSAFLCTYVDKEGMMQGTDIEWFRSLRDATDRRITAAGGITTMRDVEALSSLGIDCAIGMSIYTGRLSLDELRQFNLTSP